MRILCVDIGTGTQDVLLYDTRLDPENGYRMIVPSPTMIVRKRVQQATRRREDILLTGLTMGGGPSHWAVEDHLSAGCRVYATPDAARSFNDDLAVISSMGIEVLSEDEAAGLPETVVRLELKDLDFDGIAQAFEGFGVSLRDLSLVAAAVFDHGAAPPDYSDRKFRFEFIERQIRAHNRLSAFAFRAGEVPPAMTRMKAVAASAGTIDVPLMLMDTAPAAVLGATLDDRVRSVNRCMIANIGNFHTLAFRLGATGIEGVFEHHTGFMSATKLDNLFNSLADGTLTDEDVFDDQGHGARVFTREPLPLEDEAHPLVVVGPRRKLALGSRLRPYFASPFGDMMLVGCFGMLAAVPDVFPEMSEELTATLFAGGDQGKAPWDA